MREHHCTAGCRCPNCDDTMAAVMAMDTDSYSRWLQKTTAGMLATAPAGPGLRTEMRHFGDYEVADPGSDPATPSPAPRASTPPEVVAALAAAKRREMQAEQEGREVRRRIRTEIARDFEYVRKNPVTNGYSEALARQHGTEPELDIYQHGPLPCPYTLALGEIVQRRADGTPVRLPEGDHPPDGYALALEARRLADREDNDN